MYILYVRQHEMRSVRKAVSWHGQSGWGPGYIPDVRAGFVVDFVTLAGLLYGTSWEKCRARLWDLLKAVTEDYLLQRCEAKYCARNLLKFSDKLTATTPKTEAVGR
jgi:hypothetical protein